MALGALLHRIGMTIVETSGLVLVLVLGIMLLGRGEGDLSGALTPPEGSGAAAAVLGSALVAFYSFVGFETSANLAEEVRDVRRVYPRALFASLVTAGVVYVLIGLVAPAVVERTGQQARLPVLARGVQTDVVAPDRMAEQEPHLVVAIDDVLGRDGAGVDERVDVDDHASVRLPVSSLCDY